MGKGGKKKRGTVRASVHRDGKSESGQKDLEIERGCCTQAEKQNPRVDDGMQHATSGAPAKDLEQYITDFICTRAVCGKRGRLSSKPAERRQVRSKFCLYKAKVGNSATR